MIVMPKVAQELLRIRRLPNLHRPLWLEECVAEAAAECVAEAAAECVAEPVAECVAEAECVAAVVAVYAEEVAAECVAVVVVVNGADPTMDSQFNRT
jgi:hypothetical protein